MLRQVLDLFMINVDLIYVMRENQTLEDLTSKILVNVSEVIKILNKFNSCTCDTATTMASSSIL